MKTPCTHSVSQNPMLRLLPCSLFFFFFVVESSRKIEKAKDEMADMGSSVRTSQRLLAKYDRRELTDKLLIIAGLSLFFGVVLYILKKRVLGWIW